MEDVAKAAKDFFPNFEIARINNHLRLTKNVSDEVQRLASNSGVPNDVLMSNSNLPSNIAEGHPFVCIQDKHHYSRETLEYCLGLCDGLKTMIVVETKLACKYLGWRQSVLETLDIPHDEETIDDILLFSGNFYLLKKHIESFGKKVIFLTDEPAYRSTEVETCQWVCDQTDIVLVTTPPYIKGFECEAIIDFTSMEEPDVISRATIRVIKVSGRSEIIEIDDEFFLTKMIGMQYQGLESKWNDNV